MNKQLKLLENENKKISKEIDALKPDIEENEKKLAELTDQLEEAQKEYDSIDISAVSCVKCNKCREHCPQGIDIPTLLDSKIKDLFV